jgi:hypothetical protein
MGGGFWLLAPGFQERSMTYGAKEKRKYREETPQADQSS